MANLREQLIKILPSVLPDKPDDAILGGELLQRVKGKLVGDYADSSIRQHFSVLAGDAESPIARLEEKFGYYLRPSAVSGRKPSGSRSESDEGRGEPAKEPGRDEQLEEKFRAVFVRYSSLANQFPMVVDHTAAKRREGGVNRWKFPDVILLEWDVGQAKDEGFRLDRDLLEVKRRLGGQPFRLSSVELKVELSLADFRAAFFQCVSNSKWAHNAVLAVASSVADKTLAEELRRLGSSYEVTVVTYGLSRGDLDEFPAASAILKMEDSEFEGMFASKIRQARVATGASRVSLDWEHIRDMRTQSQEFAVLFEWVSKCLEEKTPFTYDDFRQMKRTRQRYQ